MAHTTSIRPDDHQTRAKAMRGERRASVRRVSLEQEKADFAAWLREYRRWTRTGAAPPARTGEIEWGGEDTGSTSH